MLSHFFFLHLSVAAFTLTSPELSCSWDYAKLKVFTVCLSTEKVTNPCSRTSVPYGLETRTPHLLHHCFSFPSLLLTSSWAKGISEVMLSANIR